MYVHGLMIIPSFKVLFAFLALAYAQPEAAPKADASLVHYGHHYYSPYYYGYHGHHYLGKREADASHYYGGFYGYYPRYYAGHHYVVGK